jgi:hypothetical protein
LLAGTQSVVGDHLCVNEDQSRAQDTFEFMGSKQGSFVSDPMQSLEALTDSCIDPG